MSAENGQFVYREKEKTFANLITIPKSQQFDSIIVETGFEGLVDIEAKQMHTTGKTLILKITKKP